MKRLINYLQRSSDPFVRTVDEILRDAAPGCGISWGSNHGAVRCDYHAHNKHWWIGEADARGGRPWSFVAFGAEDSVGAGPWIS